MERIFALSRRTQIVAAVVAAALLAVIVSVGFAIRPQRVALFAYALKPEQLGEVQERLASWNAPFTPTADNVLVETGSRNALLLKLSLAGVPHAHLEPSTDVLAKLGALTPQAVIDAQTRDGLAADIALALRGIDGVQDASVIIAPARAAYFADDAQHDASASVRLRLIAGFHLSSAAISGIRSFVAASVEGLNENSVTIVDDRGVALTASAEGDDAQMQTSLQSALDAALGAGVAIVRVHVDYDRRDVSIKRTRRTPLLRAPLAASTQAERYTGAGKRYEQTVQQVDRGSDVEESSSAQSGTRVARVTAAVLVDASRSLDLTQVHAVSAAAIGLNPARGDVLDVEAVSFSHPAAAKKDAWWLAYGAIVPMLPAAVIALAALVALRLCAPPVLQLIRDLLHRSELAHGTADARGVTPATVRGALRNEPPHTAAAIISALPAATAAAVLDMYPAEERAAIIRRMQRPHSHLIPDLEQVIADA